MNINRRIKPLYPALAVAIALLAPGANSFSNERDPFRFGSAYSSQPEYDAGAGHDRAVLEMILITDRRQIAVFNGRPYRKGDFVGDYAITKIEFSKVTMENGTDEIFFTLRAK